MSRYGDAELLTREQARALAVRLRALRKERGWSQARLAGESGVSPAAISHAESRYTRPTTVSAGKLAAALGMTLEELAGSGPARELTERERAGEGIRRLRRQRGWTQRRLGVEAGRSQSAVHQAEKGNPSVMVPTLNAIAAALGTTLAGLTGGAP